MHRIFGLHVSSWKLFLLGGDLVAFIISGAMAVYFNPKIDDKTLFLLEHLMPISLVGLTYMVVLYIADLYDYQRDYRRWSNIAQLILACFIGALAVIVLFYFPLGAFVGRTLLIIQASSFAGLLVLWRLVFSGIALPERLQRRLLIVGAGSSGRQILQAIRKRPRSGLVAVGFLDDDPRKIGAAVGDLPVLGQTDRLPEFAQELNASLAVVAITHEKSQKLIRTLTRASWHGLQVIDMPSFYEFLSGKVPIDHISDVWVLFNGLNKHRFYSRYLKRLIDLGLAILWLTVTAPVSLLMALAIKMDSPGPVFYRQERLGYEAKPFRIIKFRTMIHGAEKLGPQWSESGDPRVTRVGRWLRKTRLDELPQLLNILKGEMSFIGPRPEREVFIKKFQDEIPRVIKGRRSTDPPGLAVSCGYRETLPYYSYRLLVKPGLTGWAQVMYPYASSLEQTKEKLQYDLYYIKNMGFFLDLAIILKTVRIVIFGGGA
jgi:exopolysaccharide biosynthesis polyprenyl glycosylphosphotransferase